MGIILLGNEDLNMLSLSLCCIFSRSSNDSEVNALELLENHEE